MDQPRRTIPPDRKATYYLGMGIGLFGLLLFLSVFVSGAANFGNFDNFDARTRSMATCAITGMILMFVGTIVASIGAKGLAGSGAVLDPEQARKDVEPWSRMAGGVLEDALSEVKTLDKLAHPPVAPEPKVQVRCRSCHGLNDENAKYCNQCGTRL
jgi:hypothetical protein